MNPRLKIALSAVFVLAVAFFVARGCMKKPEKRAPAPKPPVTKKAPKPVKEAPAAVPAPAEGAKLAIILDDWGMNPYLMKDAVEIGRPITLAILPNLQYSREIAKEAAGKGLGVMLHMPMQPLGTGHRLEPQTILTTTPDAEIVRYLDEALASVPHVRGVNNHMGSAATQDPRVMRAVLGRLGKKGLFFVDSATISKSAAPKAAADAGVAFAKRDVFLDNDADLETIKTQLRRAARVAAKFGKAVAIGHDKKLTLRAIREMVPEIEAAGVRLVLAEELVEKA